MAFRCIKLHNPGQKPQHWLIMSKNFATFYFREKTAAAQWLRRCATNRKVAGSIPDGVIGIFH